MSILMSSRSGIHENHKSGQNAEGRVLSAEVLLLNLLCLSVPGPGK